MKLSKKKELKVLNKQNNIEHCENVYTLKDLAISTPIYLAGWGLAVAAGASPFLAVGVTGSLITGDWNYACSWSIMGITASLAANIFLPVASDTIEDITDKLTGKILDAIDHSR